MSSMRQATGSDSNTRRSVCSARGATTMVPQASRPSSARRPGLSASIVTVTSAITQPPGAWPVWAERPEGTSTDTTRAPEALSASIQMSKGADGSPAKPVPSMESSTTSARAKRFSSCGRGGATWMRMPLSAALLAAMRARSLLIWLGWTGETMRTSRPARSSSSAATQPSPPLLPKPTHTTTVRTSGSEITSCAAAVPARCMSSDMLTPARLSASSTRLTSSTLSTGCIRVTPLVRPAPRPRRLAGWLADLGGRGGPGAHRPPMRNLSPLS